MPYREDEFFGIWNEGKLIGASLDDQIQIAVFGEEEKKGHPDQIEGTTTAKSEILVSNTASSSSGTAVPTITIRCGADRTITVNDTTINISCGEDVSMNMTASSVDIKCGKSVSMNMTNSLTTINGDVKVSGDIEASGDVTAGTVSLTSHTHQGTCNYAGAYTTLAPGVPAPPKPTSDNSES
jgi:FtsP/CotA-like multicopper oxidase with cupredoxin domain